MIVPNNEPQNIKALEQIGSNCLEHCDLDTINVLPKFARRELLPYLALMFDVDITGLEEKQARNLIANAIEIHRYGGTLYAVKKALSVCFDSFEIKEWFAFNGEPYTFKIQVKINEAEIFKAEKFLKAKKIIANVKNERSKLLGIEVKFPKGSTNIFSGVGVVCGVRTKSPYRFLHKAESVINTQKYCICKIATMRNVFVYSIGIKTQCASVFLYNKKRS